MRSIELNEKGNFSPWQSHLLSELKNENITTSLGQELLFKNESMKIWDVMLAPGERLPFRKINCNFSFVSITDGMIITRSGNGRIGLHHLEKGDSQYMPLENSNTIYDIENIGEDTLIMQLSEFNSVFDEAYLEFETILNRKQF